MWRRLLLLKSETVPLRQMPALGFQTAILRPTTSRPAQMSHIWLPKTCI